MNYVLLDVELDGRVHSKMLIMAAWSGMVTADIYFLVCAFLYFPNCPYFLNYLG